MKIIKFVNLVSVENCIFINKFFSCKSYSVFSDLYNLATGRHNHQTRFAMNGLLILPNCNTAKFGTKAFLYSTITSWNFFQALFSEKNFRILSPISLKKLLKDCLISLHFWEIPFLFSKIPSILQLQFNNIYIYVYVYTLVLMKQNNVSWN